MTQRRMLTRDIICSSHFMKLPIKSQFLYIHLVMDADDDGFIANPQAVAMITQTSKRDLNELVKQRYLYIFSSGVGLIRHWKLHNHIRADRYRATIYTEKNQVYESDAKTWELIEEYELPDRPPKKPLKRKMEAQIRNQWEEEEIPF